jgi:GMP synthase (glutamine-hydrolysing)
LDEEIERFENVVVVNDDCLFKGLDIQRPIPLAEHHIDYVSEESLDRADFILLAKSDSCEVEAVKHKTSPFYGVQFHPERIVINGESHTEGHKIIENFYRYVVKR